MNNSIIHYKKDEQIFWMSHAYEDTCSGHRQKKCVTRGVGNYVFFFNDRYLHTSQDSSKKAFHCLTKNLTCRISKL